MFCLDRGRQTLTLRGETWTRERLAQKPGHADPALDALFRFLAEWFAPEATLAVHTSGSTGAPALLRADKGRMMESARMTCAFLGLHPGDRALLCMPLDYIAGKMLVVRALVAGLDLEVAAPSARPLRGLSRPPAFAAMVPLQVRDSLEHAEDAALLRGIDQLIIGGGPVPDALAKRVRALPGAVWSTYGMTETLSHIALRRLNGPLASDWYTPFEGVRVALSPEGTLRIAAPRLLDAPLTTNDLAELDARGRFRVLGRRDNTILCGGLKLQMEAVEACLATALACPFQITAAPDARLGECAVLLVQAPLPPDTEARCAACLPRYWRPRYILAVDELPLTATGKPARARARALARRRLAEGGA